MWIYSVLNNFRTRKKFVILKCRQLLSGQPVLLLHLLPFTLENFAAKILLKMLLETTFMQVSRPILGKIGAPSVLRRLNETFPSGAPCIASPIDPQLQLASFPPFSGQFNFFPEFSVRTLFFSVQQQFPPFTNAIAPTKHTFFHPLPSFYLKLSRICCGIKYQQCCKRR